jgi:phosphate-selective porin
MKKISLIGTVLFLILITSQQTTAQSTNDVLNILVQKGTLTRQEADSIRANAASEKKYNNSENKPISADVSATSFQIKGFTQVRYQSFENAKATPTSGFDVRRARLDLRGSFSSKWDYRMQIDFGGTPVKPVDLYVIYKPFGEYLKFTAGQFYIPFSGENVAADVDLELIDRSQVVNALVARSGDKSNGLIDSVGNQNGRDVGLQASGKLIQSGSRYLVDYYFAVLDGAGINVVDNNKYKDISTRVIFHPISIVDIGGSYYDGRDNFTSSPTISQKRIRWGAELALNYRAFSLKSEIIKGQEGNSSSKHIDHEGGYVQASYFFIPKKLQAVLKYDAYNPNRSASNLQSTYYILGVNYFFNKWAKIQIDYRKAEGNGSINYRNDLFVTQLQIQF